MGRSGPGSYSNGNGPPTLDGMTLQDLVRDTMKTGRWTPPPRSLLWLIREHLRWVETEQMMLLSSCHKQGDRALQASARANLLQADRNGWMDKALTFLSPKQREVFDALRPEWAGKEQELFDVVRLLEDEDE